MMQASEFQSSPAPKSRSNAPSPRLPRRKHFNVSILSGPEEAGATPSTTGRGIGRCFGFNPSPAPKEPEQRAKDSGERLRLLSFNLLSGPEEAGATENKGGIPKVRKVFSILSGPEEPEQRRSAGCCGRGLVFQSSPAPKSRSNLKTTHLGSLSVSMFQSSPAPKSRSNAATDVA